MSQYPYFEVLSYHDPEEREKWRSICQSFKDIDIFYYPEYVYLFGLKGDGKAQCFVYYDENGIVISPFLTRQINEVECFSALSDDIIDISSPYGYAGYLRNDDQVDMNKFYKIFKDYCKKNNVVSEFIRFHPLIDNLSYCPAEIASHKVNETVIINLSLTPEEIWQNLTPSCRNKVRKARRAELMVVQDKQFENLDKFHELYTNTMERLGAQQYYFFTLGWFYTLVELLGKDVALFHARWNNTIVMSGLFLLSDQYIHYYLSGSDYGLSHLPANNLLLYEVALWAKNRGIKFFHLGGGFQPKDNLFKFKASFSPRRASFFTGQAIYFPEIYEDLSRKRWAAAESAGLDKRFFPAYRALAQKLTGAPKIHPPDPGHGDKILRQGKALNILFTNVGRRVSLIRAFRETMAELGISGRILGVDANPLAPAYHITDQSLMICRINDDKYIPSLLELCLKEKINLLMSLLDTDLLKLSESKELFSKHGIFSLISSPEVVRLARDKHLTRQFFCENDIPTPRIFTYKESLEEKRFPLFIKPKDGSASLLTFRIDDRPALKFFRSYVPYPIIQEFIPGDEYTMDIFIDLDGKIRAVVPRKRLEVRSGEVSKSQIVLDPKILDAGRKVAEALSRKGGLGPINVQCIYTPEGGVKFIEINPRFGGGTPLSLKAGYPFPRWIIEMVLGLELSPLPNDLGDGLTMLRYDDAIFIRQPGGQA